MRVWQTVRRALEAEGRCLLVTVLEARGSAPREAGARLVVLPSGGFYGSIGGGTLEWQALAAAQKELKADDPSFRLRDFALGPQLGQCCGGSVKLAFEVFDTATADTAVEFATREADGAFRTVGHIGGVWSESGLGLGKHEGVGENLAADADRHSCWNHVVT